MPSAQQLGGATLIGAVCGIRTFTGPAALAVRGRVGGTPVRLGLALAAAGELIGDKLPVVPSRTAPPALAGRAVSGALSGRAVGGTPGLVLGAAGAMAGAFGGRRARTGLTSLTGLPSAVTGVVEDGVAAGAAALATRDPQRPSAGDAAPWLLGAARGAVAGVAGTAAMTAAQMAMGSSSRTPEKATRKVLRGVFGTDVERRRRDTLNQAAHWAYGTWWGVALGLTSVAVGRRPPIQVGGPALGLTAWTASLIELPALGVAPPAWRQPPGSLAIDAGFHMLHGVTTAAALRVLP